MKGYQVGCVGFALLAISWWGGMQYERSKHREMVHYIDKVRYVDVLNPHMQIKFAKDGTSSLVLVDRTGKIWESVGPNNGQECRFGKNFVADCAFDGGGPNGVPQ